MNGLRPHQVQPAQELFDILNHSPSAVDWSDTGIGKTYVAAWIIKRFDLPALVIGPKISRTAWTNALAHFGTSASFCNYELLRTGNQPFGSWDSYTPPSEYFQCEICRCRVDIEKWTPCYAHPRGIHCLDTKRKPAKYGNFVFHPGVCFAVFDESHRCNGLDSLNAELLVAARRQGIKTLSLSATPAHSPLHLRALGYSLDLHNDSTDFVTKGPHGLPVLARPNFYRWASRHKCRRDPRFHGFKWFAGKEEQVQIMREIRDSVIPARGVRVTRASIPGFPTCDIAAELYDLDSPEQIDRAYQEMVAPLSALKERMEFDKAPEGVLTTIIRARQKIELLKVPIFSELAEDYYEKGISIAFFVNFTQTIQELAKRFPDAGIIDGKTKGRTKAIADFQANKSRRIIVNNLAGDVSLSLHDLHGGFPRGGLVSAGFSAPNLTQIFGRLPRDGGRSHSFYRVIFAAGSIEVKVWKAIKPKLDAGQALVDSDLIPDNLNIR